MNYVHDLEPRGSRGHHDLLQSRYQNNQPANNEATIVDFTGIPGARYLATGKVKAFSTGTSNVSCGISASNSGGSDSSTWSSPANGSRTRIPVLPFDAGHHRHRPVPRVCGHGEGGRDRDRGERTRLPAAGQQQRG